MILCAKGDGVANAVDDGAPLTSLGVVQDKKL